MCDFQSLNGIWDYRIGKGNFTKKEVPFSALPVGHSECKRVFNLENKAEKVFLRFDGITYYARVFLNGKMLGEMLPYSEYSFDISQIAQEKDNELLVEIEDISPEFGPTEGWENYGGIIRDVSLFYKSEENLKDVFFFCELKNDYKDAEYLVEIEASVEDVEWEITLSDDLSIIDKYITKSPLKRTVKDIKLWSPESPNLYNLEVNLIKDGNVKDIYNCKVGFREFKCDRHRFILNGKPLFLQGVCKHEMFEDSGHTVTEEQIERDLELIKKTGCNFVRMEHYPHSKKTLEIADKIGLMVSEEPGLWWSETQVKAVAEGSLEVLRRTILRDRNHPSIVFWLCFNECKFTEQFLIDSARVCRENDPTRLVSGANCMSDEDTLKYYNICNFDFYTMHPYSDTFARAATSAKILVDKPLMFTEWGGYFVYDNPHLLTDFITEMYRLYENNSDDGALAGASFWYWAEVNDFGRGKPACVEGVLKEALVDIHRNPTMIYEPYKKAWEDAKKSENVIDNYYYNSLGSISGKPLFCDSATDTELLKNIFSEKKPEKFNRMRGKIISVGPVLQKEAIKGINLVPFMLTKDNPLIFKGEAITNCISVVGLTTDAAGYPIMGEYGERAGEIIIEIENGGELVKPLRNGMEFTTAFSSIGSSRINPVAENTERIAEFGYEKNFENYVINRLNIKLPQKELIKTVELKITTNKYTLLIYGVYA